MATLFRQSWKILSYFVANISKMLHINFYQNRPSIVEVMMKKFWCFLTNSVCSQQSLIYIESRRPRVDWRSGGRTPADTRQRGSINHVRVLVEMVQAMSVSVERRTEQAVGRAWGGSGGSTPRGSSDLGVVPDSRGRRRCSVTGPPRINHVERHTTLHRQRELELQ